MCFCTARLNRNAPRRWTGHDRLPVVLGHLEQQVVAQHAGVVDQHGGAPSSATDPLGRGRDLGRVGDVGADGERGAAGVVDAGDGAGAGALVQVHHGDRHAVGGELAGGGFTDAAGGSGDDRDAAGLGHAASCGPDGRL
jgi:hypothetical protein